MKMNSSNIFFIWIYAFGHYIWKCWKGKTSNNTHVSSYEILYDQKQRWNPVRNHTKRWAWPMRVCVCIADIEQSCLFQYLNQREKSKFCIVDHRKIGSICNLFMAQFFSLLSFYISFWARINGSSCAYILSKARNHMIRVFFSILLPLSNLLTRHSKCKMLNFKWSSNFLFVGIATGSCQFILPSIFYYIHIFSLNIFLYFHSPLHLDLRFIYLTFTLMPFINWKILVRFSFRITEAGGQKREGWEAKNQWHVKTADFMIWIKTRARKTKKPFPLSQFSQILNTSHACRNRVN